MSMKDKDMDLPKMIEKHKKDLDYVKEEAQAMKKLNQMTFMPKTYEDVLVFCLNVAEYCGEAGDIKFIKSLPQSEEEFQKLDIDVKSQLLDLGKKQQEFFKTNTKDHEYQMQVLDKTKDSVISRLLNKLQAEMDAYRQELSKKDFPSGWECAVYCKKMYFDGELSNDVKSITDAYKWGVKHCTIKGKEIERYTVIASAYDNTKHNRTKGGTAIDEFEEKYKDKIK